MPIQDRFPKGDEFPDGTWGTCKIHSPSSIIRLVDDFGQPAVNGVCQMCWAETHDPNFFCCPIHGINAKAPGKEGCPVAGCVGESPGPTEEEIARETEALGRIWPGGPLATKDAVDETPARPANERDREAGVGAQHQAGNLSRGDPGGAGQDRQREAQPATVDRSESDVWVDPFLIEEP